MPRKSYKRAYEILAENDYPAVGSHGRNNNGRLYQLGGVSKFNFSRCRYHDEPATMDDGLQSRVALMRELGAFPAEGFGFDLNGFAGAPGPRFGENSHCAEYLSDCCYCLPVHDDLSMTPNSQHQPRTRQAANLRMQI